MDTAVVSTELASKWLLSQDDLFYCESYSCRMTERACALRQHSHGCECIQGVAQDNPECRGILSHNGSS